MYSLALGISLSDKIRMYLETFGEDSDFSQISSNLDGGDYISLKAESTIGFFLGDWHKPKNELLFLR